MYQVDIPWTISTLKTKKLQKFTKKWQKLKKQNWEQIAHSYLSLNLHISSISFSQLAESIRYPLQHGFSQELCKVVGQHITDCMLKLFNGWGALWIHFSPPSKKKSHMGWFHMNEQAIREAFCVQATALEVNRWGSGEQLSRKVAPWMKFCPEWRSCLDG